MKESESRLASVDFTRLGAWMLRTGLTGGAIEERTLLAGGTQNIIVRFRSGSREFVLRKASDTAHLDADRTIGREARLLGALSNTCVPHARLIAACLDRTVLGGSFYLMEPVDGFNVGLGMPLPHAGDARLRREMGFSLVDGLIALRSVDPASAGLADFGRVDGFLERQPHRWRRQLEDYSRYAHWPGARELPYLDAITSWLENHIPNGFRPSIIHGDYHIKNVIFRHESPALAAIVDWELSTIGAPMIDLGWLVATWRDPGSDDGGSPIVVEPWEGFPTSSELVARYSKFTGDSVAEVPWYAVLACYKLAVLLEGTFARSCADRADRELGERFHRNAIRLMERAARWLT